MLVGVSQCVEKTPWFWNQKKQDLNPSFAPLTASATLGKVNSPLGFLFYKTEVEKAPTSQGCSGCSGL